MNDSIDPPSKEVVDAQLSATPQAQIAPREPSTLYTIFFGKDGLRAGWGLLIFVVLMVVVLSGVNTLGSLLHILPNKNAVVREIPPSYLLFAEALPFLVTLLVTWIMSVIERRPNSVYGLGGTRKASNFISGLAWGVTCLTLLVLTLWLSGLLLIDRRLLFGVGMFHYGALWLMGFLCVGLLEEYLTRGYLLFTLTRGLAGLYSWMFQTRHSQALGFWTAAIVLSILFGLGHGKNPGESPIGLLSAGLASVVFCLSLWRTGSLWWAIGFHTSWDWAQSFLYGVADSGLMVQHHLLATHPLGKALMSGGTTGPEGSVLVLPILALVCLLIVFTLSRGKYLAAAS